MASYITLKANKIVGIYRSDGGKTTYRSNDARGVIKIFLIANPWPRALNAPSIVDARETGFSRSIIDRPMDGLR